MQRRTFLLTAAAQAAWAQSSEFPALEKWRGVHPRLFLTPEREPALRTAITGPLAAQWKAVKAQADTFVSRKPPAFHDTGDGEQLWQREVGNTQPFLAIAARFTGDEKYLRAAETWCLASCGYATWGPGQRDGGDLAAGHQLLGLALCYDWLFDRISPEAKKTIRETLLRRGRQMLEAATQKQYWRESYLQNHLWVNIAGLAAAGLALFDDAELGAEVQEWIRLPLDKFRATEDVLGEDGASHEGVPYWSYGVEYMLKFWSLASDLLGQDLSSGWWRNTAAYRLYMGLPRKSWVKGNTLVDIADAPTADWYGPDFMLRNLAARYGDGHAQWLAKELEEAQVTGASARWLNLFWYNPSITAVPPNALPTLRHFDDMGLVSARTDWSGDESLVVFKCGPPAGHDAMSRFNYDAGCGHVHPDANHFVVFGAGEWLIRDDGYAWKQTDQHNTLLVDGKGQLGEGAQWFKGIEQIRLRARARIVRVKSTATVDEMEGDATPVYPAALGLKRFTRRLIYLKPDVLLVVDDVATDTARPLELRFHPAITGKLEGAHTFAAIGKQAALRIETLTPEGVEMTASDVPMRHREGSSGTMFAVRLNTQRAAWRNAVAISWAHTGAEPAKVTLEQAGNRWVFRAGGRTAEVRWE